jgi:hypothetical protein
MGPVGGPTGGKTMKRALTAAVLGSLIALFVPEAAFADHDAGRAGEPRGEQAGRPAQQSPPERAHQDRPHQEDTEEGEFLLF